MERIRTWLDPWSDAQGAGFHTVQGLLALGAGGIFGRGLGQSLVSVPNAFNDFIFAEVGQEFEKALQVLTGAGAKFHPLRLPDFPYDDVADIELRALEGALCGKAGSCGTQTTDPNKGTPYTDGARAAGPDASHLTLSGQVNPGDTYLDVFPYLNTPLPGSPHGSMD